MMICCGFLPVLRSKYEQLKRFEDGKPVRDHTTWMFVPQRRVRLFSILTGKLEAQTLLSVEQENHHTEKQQSQTIYIYL